MTRFFRASGMLAVGFAMGVLAAGAGIAVAAMGKAGWDRFGPMFKQGYAAGFNDAVRMAKTSDPQSFLAKQFRLPPSAKAIDWVAMIDELYAQKENENRPLPQIFSIAGPKMEERFGSEADAARKAFEERRKEFEKQREAKAKPPEGQAPAGTSPASGPDASPERTGAVAPASAPSAAPGSASAPAASSAPTPAEKPADTKQP